MSGGRGIKGGVVMKHSEAGRAGAGWWWWGIERPALGLDAVDDLGLWG